MTSSDHDDRLDDLGRWIRQTEEAWVPDVVERMSDARMRTLTAAAVVSAARPRRRRRIIGGAIAVVALTSTAAAAAVLLTDQPTAPEAGVVCRASFDVDADAVVLEPGIDAVAGCRNLWEERHFGATGGPQDPDLVACIGEGGAIEVFPGPSGSCEHLGLAPAADELSSENAEVVHLNEALTEQINAAPCVPVSEASSAAEQIVQQSGLIGWEVVVSPGSEGGTCGKVAIDSAVQKVFVNQL